MTHEKPTPAPVEVTPKDREAYLALNMLPEKYAADVRAGRWDEVTGMQVLAHHRIAHSAPAGEVVATYRHVKRGTTYQVVGAAELQATAYNVHEGDKLTIYRGQDGKLWARHEDEFHDGRFEQVEGTHPAPPADVVELVEALREAREAIHHRGGPLCKSRYYSASHCDCGAANAIAKINTALAKHGGA